MANSLIASLGLDTADFQSGISEAKSVLKNFTDQVRKQVSGITDFAKGLKSSATEALAMARGMSAGELAMKAVTLASKALKVALISTGIGAIVVALGSLVAYLTTTQAGMDALRQVTEPVAQIFGRLLGVLQELGGSVFKGIALMLKGELAEGFRVMSEGAKQAGRSTVNAFKDGIEAGSRLAEMTKQIELAENDLILTRSRLNRQIKENQEQAMLLAQTNSQEARKYAEEAIRLIDEQAKAEDDLLAMKIERMKLEHEANDTSRADYKELNMLIAQREDLQARAAQQRQRLNSVLVRADRDAEKSMSNIVRFSDDAIVSTEGLARSLDTGLDFSHIQVAGVALRNYAQEAIDAKRAQEEFNREMELTGQITGLLSGFFDSVFNAMITNGQNAFKVLIQGIKAIIARLLVAVATATALAVLFSALGLGAFSFSSLGKGIKGIFGQLSGLGALFDNKMAEGGMVTGLTTAILGDNPSGKEAVIPFEKMGSFLSQFGTNQGGGTFEFVLRGEDLYASNKKVGARELRILSE